MSGTTESYLSHARYGKSNVRVLRVVREGPVHHIVEYNVTVLVEGDIDVSYTQADNSVVVATDSMKNITYYLAKTSPHILIPERFALHLGTHIVSKYAHLHKAFVTVEQLRWSRIVLGKQEHNHSFLRDGDEKKVVKVEVDATAGKDKIIGKVSSGISDLLVLKSTGSAFHSFVRDEYTLLAETHDRIFSTSVDLTYTFEAIEIPAPKDEFKLEFNVPKEEEGGVWDTKVWERARNVTLEVFAEDDSASVQATLYKMAQRIITENKGVGEVEYVLPNKHYIPVELVGKVGAEYKGKGGEEKEVFMPISAPSGLISARVTRRST